MNVIQNDLPGDNEAARGALYAGTAYHLAPGAASLALAGEVMALLAAELPGDVRRAQEQMTPEAYFGAMGRVRRRIFEDEFFHDAVRAVLAEHQFDPGRVAFDPLRLRVIAHRGQDNPRAAAVYYPHRDTWYGHGASMLVWWIPLHDCDAEETFVFYPEYFRRPVPNDSEIFDYDDWKSDRRGLKIGWQNRDAGLDVRYPGVTESIDPGPAVGFAAKRGENLIFSGAHFHRTLAHSAGRTRFSVDFRMVHLDDEAQGRGAPAVDDRSRGSALADYVQPASGAPA